MLLTRPPGYALKITSEQCDLLRFESLLRRGQRAIEAGAVAEASTLLDEALLLWRGEPLADVAADNLRQLEAPRLSELQRSSVSVGTRS